MLILLFLSQSHNNSLNFFKGNKKPMQASNRCAKGMVFSFYWLI